MGGLGLSYHPKIDQAMDRTPEGAGTRRMTVAGVAAMVIANAPGMTQLKSAAPGVDTGTIWTDYVRRGPMVRAVPAIGTLVETGQPIVETSGPVIVLTSLTRQAGWTAILS